MTTHIVHTDGFGEAVAIVRTGYRCVCIYSMRMSPGRLYDKQIISEQSAVPIIGTCIHMHVHGTAPISEFIHYIIASA